MPSRALFPFLVVSLFTVVLTLVTSPAVHADWLVTVDGAQIETQGAYKVEGRRIVFTTTAGTLSAVRASTIDLEASDRLTAEKQREAVAARQGGAQPANSPARAALVLDENNTGRHLTLSEASDPDAISTAAADGGEAGLEVLSWQENQGGTEDLVLVGRLRNNTNVFATEMTLKVEVRDETGSISGTQNATFDRKALKPGQVTTWRAEFPGIYLGRDPSFTTSYRGFVTRDPDDGSGDAEGSDEQGEEGAVGDGSDDPESAGTGR